MKLFYYKCCKLGHVRKNKGNSARFSIKGLMFKKKIFATMFHKILMENVTV